MAPGEMEVEPLSDDGLSDPVKDILELLKDEIREVDGKAEMACKQSKYSIQDYWMCLEFKLQRIHDQIAKKYNFDRLEEMPFREKLNEFRKSLGG